MEILSGNLLVSAGKVSAGPSGGGLHVFDGWEWVANPECGPEAAVASAPRSRRHKGAAAHWAEEDSDSDVSEPDWYAAASAVGASASDFTRYAASLGLDTRD